MWNKNIIGNIYIFVVKDNSGTMGVTPAPLPATLIPKS